MGNKKANKTQTCLNKLKIPQVILPGLARKKRILLTQKPQNVLFASNLTRLDFLPSFSTVVTSTATPVLPNGFAIPVKRTVQRVAHLKCTPYVDISASQWHDLPGYLMIRRKNS